MRLRYGPAGRSPQTARPQYSPPRAGPGPEACARWGVRQVRPSRTHLGTASWERGRDTSVPGKSGGGRGLARVGQRETAPPHRLAALAVRVRAGRERSRETPSPSSRAPPRIDRTGQRAGADSAACGASGAEPAPRPPQARSRAPPHCVAARDILGLHSAPCAGGPPDSVGASRSPEAALAPGAAAGRSGRPERRWGALRR